MGGRSRSNNINPFKKKKGAKQQSNTPTSRQASPMERGGLHNNSILAFDTPITPEERKQRLYHLLVSLLILAVGIWWLIDLYHTADRVAAERYSDANRFHPKQPQQQNDQDPLVSFASSSSSSSSSSVTVTGRVLDAYPHDARAFTQGLLIHKGRMYESTGLYGHSSLRVVELETGEVLQQKDFPKDIFAEGIAVLDDVIYMLTWKERILYEFDLELNQLRKQFYPKWLPQQGWGLTTYNDRFLVMSDGSDTLLFLKAGSLEIVKKIRVKNDKNSAVSKLNELEMVNGKLVANIWYDNRLAVLNDPKESGHVDCWIDLSHLPQPRNNNAVLNGIAFQQDSQELYVTGKLWNQLYKIELPACLQPEADHKNE